MKILLDYFFPITSITPTPAASTAYLKQVCIVTLPKDGSGVEPGVIVECATLAEVQAVTDRWEPAEQLFNAGMSKVFVLQTNTLQLAEFLAGHETDFFTLLITPDFSDASIDGSGVAAETAVKAKLKVQDITYTAVTAGVAGNAITIEYIDDTTAGDESVSVDSNAITVFIETGVSTAAQIKTAILASDDALALISAAIDAGDNARTQVTAASTPLATGADAVTPEPLDVGAFKGVVGCTSDDTDFLATQAAIENRCAFYSDPSMAGRNMFFAFGKLLSNALNWLNQQYITMPFDDLVNTLGDANSLFDDRASFVISDSEFGKRLALFAAGGKAIAGPYIKRNLELDMQSAGLQYVSGNQPGYTKTQAALLEDELQKVVDSYIDRQWIDAGVAEVKLEQDNFIASGYFNIAEPKALWRIFGQMKQTL